MILHDSKMAASMEEETGLVDPDNYYSHLGLGKEVCT